MAYIGLIPVRAGMMADPAGYRWSGYGEEVGGGAKVSGKKAGVLWSEWGLRVWA